MTDVVRTRLRPPRPDPSRMVRHRAAAAFEDAAGVPLVCVEADAGYGKTTFVDTVTAGQRRAWYALTVADRDPHTFLAHVVAAVATSAPGANAVQPTGTGWSALLDVAVDRLDTWAADGGTYLVLDDYHTVHGSPVDGVIGRLLELLPATVQIVATSRTHLDPGSWGSRSTAYDAVRTIDRALLAFDDEETSAYLRSRFGVSLPPTVVELLVEETEGWPIALSLIGRRLHRGHHEAEELLAALPAGRDAIFDFLSDQVFAEQPQDVRRFLLDVSVLTPLTPESCAAVAGISLASATRMLREIAAGGLFCVATGEGHYRMHHLFGQFLESQLDPARRRDLHAAAALHHRTRGECERAAIHALAAQQPAAAARAVAVIAEQLLASGRHLTLLGLTDELGPAIDEHPSLLVARSHALRLSSRYDEALESSARAERLAERTGDGELESALRARLAVYLDTVHPAKAEDVLVRLAAVSRDPDALLAQRVENEINRGHLDGAAELLNSTACAGAEVALRHRLLVRQGRLLEARSALERHTGPRSHIPMAHREGSVLLAWVHALLGHADRGAEHARVGIDLGRDLRSPLLTCVSTGRLGLSLLSGSSNTDARLAHQHLLESLELAERLGVDRFRAEPLMGLTVLADRIGRPEDTRRFGLDAVQTLAGAGDQYLEAMARLALGAALAAQQDPTARNWLLSADAMATECGDAFVPLLADQWLAALDLAEGNRDAFGARADDVIARTADLNLADIWLTPGWLGIADAGHRETWLDAACTTTGGGAYAAHLLARIGGRRPDVRTTATARPALRITTLHGFSVHRGGTKLTADAWGRRKAVDILLLLCASERHSQSRSEILDKLWPDLTREQAAVRCRVALHALHHVLEPDRAPREATSFVRTSSDRIWLDPQTVHVDADEFRSSADRLLAPGGFDLAAGQAALALYRQPFLHDHPALDWAVPVRDELAVRFREVTLLTAGALLDLGAHAAAITACGQLLAHDPFVEPAHELLATAYLAAGDAAAAARAFRRCARLLDEELGVKPGWSIHTIRLPRSAGVTSV